MTAKRPPEEEASAVVELDAMDVAEWEQDQHTPVAPDSELAALVKKTAADAEKPATPAPGRATTTSTMPRLSAPTVSRTMTPPAAPAKPAATIPSAAPAAAKSAAAPGASKPAAAPAAAKSAAASGASKPVAAPATSKSAAGSGASKPVAATAAAPAATKPAAAAAAKPGPTTFGGPSSSRTPTPAPVRRDATPTPAARKDATPVPGVPKRANDTPAAPVAATPAAAVAATPAPASTPAAAASRPSSGWMKPLARPGTEPAPLEPPPAIAPRTEPAPLAFAPGTEPATTPRAHDRAFSEGATEVRPPDAIASAPTSTAPGVAPAPFGANDVPIEEWSVPVESATSARATSPARAAATSTTAQGFAAAPTTTAPGIAPAPAHALAPALGAAPTSTTHTGVRAETAAPLPAPPIVPAPLPAPPIVASANGSGSLPSTAAGTDALHPRAPSDWIADRVPDARVPMGNVARRDPSSVENDVLVAAPLRIGGRNRKRIALIAGGGVLLLVIIVFAATRGGSKKTSAVADKPRGSAETVAAAGEPAAGSAAGEPDEAPAATKPPAHHDGSPAAIATAPGTGSAATVAPPVETRVETPPAEAAPRKHPTLGGKKVVLEYDTPTHEVPKSTGAEEDGPVAKARAAYSAGNKRLFAGDPEGAVKAYQQALADYPGYVAGYRGLGLAYTETGDKLKAMSAFHLYLTAVPGAKDAALIKRRLTALSH